MVDASDLNSYKFWFAKEMFVLNDPNLPLGIKSDDGCSLVKGLPSLTINTEDPAGCANTVIPDSSSILDGYFMYNVNVPCKMEVSFTIDESTMNFAFFDLIPTPHSWPFTIEIKYECDSPPLTLGSFASVPSFSNYGRAPNLITLYTEGLGSGNTYSIT